MIHRTPDATPPLFAHPPDTPPRNDAAPTGIGAGVKTRATSPNDTPSTLAPAGRAAPDTSHEAARRIEGIAGEMCQRVLAYIRACGAAGATDAECQAALGMLTQTQTPRRNTLAALGAVVNSGRKRLTPSGRRAIVWVLPEYAEKSTEEIKPTNTPEEGAR